MYFRVLLLQTTERKTSVEVGVSIRYYGKKSVFYALKQLKISEMNTYCYKIVHLFLVIWLSIAGTSLVQAQGYYSNSAHGAESSTYQKWALRLQGGTSIFFGDIKENLILPSTTGKSEWRAGGSFTAEYRPRPVVGLRGQALYTQLAGTKTVSDLYFTADVMEATLAVSIYPVNLFSGSKQHKIDVYLIAGMGFTNFNSNLYQLSSDIKVASSGNGNGTGIGGRTFEPIVTAGFGIDFNLSQNWSLVFETTNKAISNDKMDLTVSQSAYDIYNFTSIGLAFKFGSGEASKSRMKNAIEKEILKQASETDKIPAKEEPVLVSKPVEIVEEVKAPIEIVVLTPVLSDTLEKEIETVIVLEVVREITTGYRVQVLASSKMIPIERVAKLKNLDPSTIQEGIFNGLYIYTIGFYDSYQEAAKVNKDLRGRSQTADAFVVYFENNQRLKSLPANR